MLTCLYLLFLEDYLLLKIPSVSNTSTLPICAVVGLFPIIMTSIIIITAMQSAIWISWSIAILTTEWNVTAYVIPVIGSTIPDTIFYVPDQSLIIIVFTIRPTILSTCIVRWVALRIVPRAICLNFKCNNFWLGYHNIISLLIIHSRFIFFLPESNR